MRVLHLQNIANIGSTLVNLARKQGHHWYLYDVPRMEYNRSLLSRYSHFLGQAVEWEIRLGRLAHQADLLHLHTATSRRYAGWVRKPYFLHCHGTDIRQRQYQSGTRKTVLNTVAKAEQVFFSTPDLVDHIWTIRPDAQLCPVTVDIERIPLAPVQKAETNRKDDKPVIVFPSRWEAVKGGQAQLQVVRVIQECFGKKVQMKGLNWGPNAEQAARLGVELVPKMSHEKYLQWLAQADLAVGQVSAVMGVSELEVLATGIPLVTALSPRWYDDWHPSLKDIPVLGGKKLPVDPNKINVNNWGKIIEQGLFETQSSQEIEKTRDWLYRHHSPQVGVNFLAKCYSDWNKEK